MAGRGRPRAQHLREGRQADAQNRVPLVRNPKYFLQRSEIRYQTHRHQGAKFRLFCPTFAN